MTQQSDGFFQSRKLDSKWLLRRLYLVKRERNLEKWPYDVIRQSDVIYSTTLLYNDTATCYNNKLTSLIYDGDRAVDWKQAKTIEGSSATNMTG